MATKAISTAACSGVQRPQAAEPAKGEAAEITPGLQFVAIGGADQKAAQHEEEIEQHLRVGQKELRPGQVAVERHMIERHQQGAQATKSVERPKPHALFPSPGRVDQYRTPRMPVFLECTPHAKREVQGAHGVDLR